MPRVLFDESHSQSWTIRRELAQQMQPAHPEDVSYARAAELLSARDLEVAAHADGPLTAERLGEADVLVVAHPSDPKWERTTGSGDPRFSREELEAIWAWVERGGGLVVLGETEQDKYGNNLNELLEPFGLRLEHDTVQDYEHHHAAPTWILGEAAGGPEGVDLFARVDSVCFYRAGTLSVSGGATAFVRSSPAATTPSAPLGAVAEHGVGRVVVLADSDLFGDDCIGELGHTPLWLNIAHWVAAPSFAAASVHATRTADPTWMALRDEVNALAALQEADGSVDLERHDAAVVRAHVEAIAPAIQALAPAFPHQAEYFEALLGDLDAWVADGFGKPDFTRSLDAFHPERDRRDGIEHLVVFPMWKQNGPRDATFEALHIRVPWPERVEALERTRYDNPKFVPVTFVDHTRGYDSDSAVLFPETVSVAGPPANHFGAIFCDREAERFRRIGSQAARLLRLDLPPDAAVLLASEEVSQHAYVLWDLIHDRAHSHGDLPFDPFMIRQRMPYWMYALEELRCDLTAFSEAMALERDGLAFARHVQYAILFDRLFRFPITGPRVRNYDGLGGQLLFAWLHKHRLLHWTDNRMSIEWDRVGAGVAALRERVEQLYREGIDRSKVAHWAAAHDLVAEYVAPATDSKWVRGARELSDEGDPRRFVDLVLPDEFPLSLFYASLKQKLAPEPPASIAA